MGKHEAGTPKAIANRMKVSLLTTQPSLEDYARYLYVPPRLETCLMGVLAVGPVKVCADIRASRRSHFSFMHDAIVICIYVIFKCLNYPIITSISVV